MVTISSHVCAFFISEKRGVLRKKREYLFVVIDFIINFAADLVYTPILVVEIRIYSFYSTYKTIL